MIYSEVHLDSDRICSRYPVTVKHRFNPTPKVLLLYLLLLSKSAVNAAGLAGFALHNIHTKPNRNRAPNPAIFTA